MSEHPELLFVAGPNGAGKSTFSEKLSKPGAFIFDVDKVIPRIATKSPAMSKKQVYQAATQEFFDEATKAIRRRQHFTLETSFRDKDLVDIAAEFKRYGYMTKMVYLMLSHIEQSTLRVNQRASNGGHFVDDKNIKLNYDIGLQCLKQFADQFDNLEILDASKDHRLESLLKVEQHQLVYLNNDVSDSLKQIIIKIADRYRENPMGYHSGR